MAVCSVIVRSICLDVEHRPSRVCTVVSDGGALAIELAHGSFHLLSLVRVQWSRGAGFKRWASFWHVERPRRLLFLDNATPAPCLQRMDIVEKLEWLRTRLVDRDGRSLPWGDQSLIDGG